MNKHNIGAKHIYKKETQRVPVGWIVIAFL